MKLSIPEVLSAAEYYAPQTNAHLWNQEWIACERLMAEKGWKIKQCVDFLVSIGAIPKAKSTKAWNALRRRNSVKNANLCGKTQVERELARVKAGLTKATDYMMSLRIK